MRTEHVEHERSSEQHYTPEREGNPFVRSTQGGRRLSAMMLPVLLASPSATFGVITTKGRRTGRRRRKCVRIVRRGDQAYVVAIPGERAAWIKNLRADPNVELRMQGGTWLGVARDPRDEDERRELREVFCETVARMDYVACCLHQRGRPSRHSVKRLHRKWCERGTTIVIDLVSRA